MKCNYIDNAETLENSGHKLSFSCFPRDSFLFLNIFAVTQCMLCTLVIKKDTANDHKFTILGNSMLLLSEYQTELSIISEYDSI